jgi:hypothetical protein
MSTNRLARLSVAVALAAAVLCLTASQAEARGRSRDGGVRAGKVEGVITAVNPLGSVTITTRAGRAVTVLVAAGTKIERNERPVALAALKVGDVAEAVSDATTAVAVKIEAVGP